MLGHKKVITLLLCLTLSLAACLNLEQPKNKIEYYTLEYDPPAVGHDQSLPYVIRVQQFFVSPIYNSNTATALSTEINHTSGKLIPITGGRPIQPSLSPIT